MNKRMAKKLYRQFNHNELTARRSCIYCCNWGLGCANGHPNVFPGDKSDYLYFCKEKLDACKFLANQLKKEGFSLSGWRLIEVPAPHVYVFYNKKKHLSRNFANIFNEINIFFKNNFFLIEFYLLNQKI